MANDAEHLTSEPHLIKEPWAASIDSLTLEQLFDLNNYVVERIKFLKELENSAAKARFSVGDQVSFVDRHKQQQFGRVDKINPKTIHVNDGDGRVWKVDPSLLRKVPRLVGESTHRFNRPGHMRDGDWMFGVVELPVSIADAPPGYVPEIVCCMDGNGLIRHSSIISYVDRAKDIITAFNRAVDNPAVGEAGAPLTLRVEDPSIVSLLSPIYPTTEFVVAEVPEVYEVAENFSGGQDDTFDDEENSFDSFDEEGGELPVIEQPGYLDFGIPASAVAGLHDAASEWFILHKNSSFVHEASCISVSIEQFGMEAQVLYILARAGEKNRPVETGLMLFSSLNDFSQWSSALSFSGTSVPDEVLERVPATATLNFIEAGLVPESFRNEVAENRWRTPATDTFPIVSVMDGAFYTIDPDTQDLQCFEVLCRGLIALMNDAELFFKTLNTGEPVSQTYLVDYSGGKVEISFALPILPAGKTRETLNLIEELAFLDRMNPDCTGTKKKQLSDVLDKQFAVSSEYKQRKNTLDTHKLLLELCVEYFGLSVASLTPSELGEFLFNLLARRALAPADCYDDMFEDVRAFFAFLYREYSWLSAGDCVAYMNEGVKEDFLDQLKRNSQDGVAGEPFDVDNIEDAFGDYWELPPVKAPKALTASQKKDKKNKRKQRKNARKKNRR